MTDGNDALTPASPPSGRRDAARGAARPRPADAVCCRPGRARAGAARGPGIEVLQVNVGKLCNQTCRHCHVDAGPDRREVMTRETMAACLDAGRRRANIPTVDITGGAPELNPHFRWLVAEARRLGRHVIDRCNLTVLLTPGLPRPARVPGRARTSRWSPRCPATWPRTPTPSAARASSSARSTALRRLNALGYGRPGSGPDADPGLQPARAEAPSRAGRARGRLSPRAARPATASSSPGCSRSPTCRSAGSSTTWFGSASTTTTWRR